MGVVKSNIPQNGGKKKDPPATAGEVLTVAALYHFAHVTDVNSLQKELLQLCLSQRIRGTLLVAGEGMNGTIAGPASGIKEVVDFIKNIPGFAQTEVKYASSTGAGFHHMRIKIKPEIVTMGKPNIDPNLAAGTYVDPQDWNDLIKREDVLVIDTRNAYEVHIGKFQGAIDPKTETFKDFPAWADRFVAENGICSSEPLCSSLDSTSTSNEAPSSDILLPAVASSISVPKAVAMYCTGGIRCEKSTVYMKQLGVQEVYHLKGGRLKYLEEVPAKDSLWEGECFGFDERVALKTGLQAGSYTRCFACKMPLSAADCAAENPRYEEGVFCTHCIDQQTPAQQQRFRERHLQIQLANERGEQHVGQHIPTVHS